MTEVFNIRLARESDVAVLVSFNVELARETEGKALEPATVFDGVSALVAQPSYGFYLVAERGTKVVGSLMVTTEWSDWRNGRYWWIQSVYVMPQFRRQGIYRALYKAVKDLAEKQGDVRGFRLYVEEQNKKAIETYLKLGMQKAPYLMFEEMID